MPQPIRVLHIVTGLHTGGAEMMLYKLLQHTDPTRFSSSVISLTPGGDLFSELTALGTLVRSLDLRTAADVPAGFIQLVLAIRRTKPDVVQTWMYHADLLGGLAARLAGHRAVAWGIQAGSLDPAETSYSTRTVIRTCARLSSRVPQVIVCCGETVREIHVRQGFDRERTVVIPNAADTDRFRPDEGAGSALREALHLPPDTPLVGMAARFHPQKDHRTLVLAAARVRRVLPGVHFVLFGEGITHENPTLREWVDDAGVRDTCHLLGRRSDVASLFAGVDVACLSSAFGEGLPNAVVEAMACAVPCVVTDVGDSRLIVGDTGRVVQPRDPDALAEALTDLLRLTSVERKDLGRRAQQRVAENFAMRAVAGRYAAVYRTLASPGPVDLESIEDVR